MEMLVVILSTLVGNSNPILPIANVLLSDHITTVKPLARSLHRSLFTSSDQFKPVQNELASLMGVLESIMTDSASFQVDCNQEPALCRLSQDCHEILNDLQVLNYRFESLPTQTQLTWDRMEWDTEELSGIRARLMTTVSSLNTVYSRQIRYVYGIYRYLMKELR
jgi:hypothetical protein